MEYSVDPAFLHESSNLNIPTAQGLLLTYCRKLDSKTDTGPISNIPDIKYDQHLTSVN